MLAAAGTLFLSGPAPALAGRASVVVSAGPGVTVDLPAVGEFGVVALNGATRAAEPGSGHSRSPTRGAVATAGR